MEKYIVISAKQEEIFVAPMIKSECAGCSTGCAKQGNSIKVDNPRKLNVAPGNVVTISMSRKKQALQGIFSLIVPFICAVAGYFVSEPVAAIFGKTASEGFKALFVLIFLFLSAAVVYIISRRNISNGIPFIKEVL